MDPYFILTDKLKKLGLIHGNVEDSQLNAVIQRVQKSTVKPVLTEKLYARFCEGITANNLTADEKKLLDDYITPLLVAACDRKAVKVVTYEIRNKGVGTTRDEYLTPVSNAERLALEDDIKLDIDVARTELVNFLRKNRSLYPLYNPCNCTAGCSCGWNSPEIKHSVNRPNISFR